MSAFHRMAQGLRHYGVVGAGRRVLAEAASLAYLHEEHVWYSLELAAARQQHSLPNGLSLSRHRGEQELFQFGGEDARERVGIGAEVWVVHDDGERAFTCWIFRERAPVLAAPGGWLDLPAGAVVLEDSVTAPSFRGRGIAPAAWSAIADSLAVEGLERMLTKVAVDNTPSRRAVEKASFEEVGIMRLTRVGPRKRVEIDASGLVGSVLAERLHARLHPLGA